ncbi:uncharacterized, partial [Tachysurus ichikawai]
MWRSSPESRASWFSGVERVVPKAGELSLLNPALASQRRMRKKRRKISMRRKRRRKMRRKREKSR